MANSVDPDQTAPIGAVCSGSTLFACIIKFASNVRQLFSADNIFRFFFLGALRDSYARVVGETTYMPIFSQYKIDQRDTPPRNLDHNMLGICTFNKTSMKFA